MLIVIAETGSGFVNAPIFASKMSASRFVVSKSGDPVIADVSSRLLMNVHFNLIISHFTVFSLLSFQPLVARRIA